MPFRVRIVTIDHYTEKPVAKFDPQYSIFRAKDIQQVPIVRIFGTSEKGYKTCLHVHGFFPYFSIQASSLDSQCSTQIFAYELDRQINSRLNRPEDVQHVYTIEHVQSTNFYGFHRESEIFLKVFFYSEQARKTALSILRSGHFMQKSFDVFEAHFNLTTQFFVSFNLFGMNFVNLSQVWPRQLSDLSLLDQSYAGSFPREKQTSCQVEIDCTTDKIMNATGMGGELNPGLKLIWTEEIARRVNLNQEKDELLKDIIDSSTRQFRQTELERKYIQSLHTFFRTGNPHELNRKLGLSEFHSQSQAWQTSLSQSKSQTAFKSQESNVCKLNPDRNAMCTQEMIDLFKYSQKLSMDEHLLQKFLDNQSDHEEEEVDKQAAEESDGTCEKGSIIQPSLVVSINPVGHSQDGQLPNKSDFELLEKDSTLDNVDEFNLDCESIIRTPIVITSSTCDMNTSFNNAFTSTCVESSLRNDFHLSEENLLFEDDFCCRHDFEERESSDSVVLISPDLRDDKMVECDLFEDSKLASTPVPRVTSSFSSSNLHSESNLTLNGTSFNFYNVESQSNQAFSSMFDSEKKRSKKPRLNANVLPFCLRSQSPNRCSTPTAFCRTGDNHTKSDFISNIRKLVNNSSQVKVHDHEFQYLTLMSMELFAFSNNALKPDPQSDPIKMIFFQVYQDSPSIVGSKLNSKLFKTRVLRYEPSVEKVDSSFLSNYCTKSASVRKSHNLFQRTRSSANETYLKTLNSEIQLVECLLESIREHDPDILIGFEIETASWGYLMARGHAIGIDCSKTFSRLKLGKTAEYERQAGKSCYTTELKKKYDDLATTSAKTLSHNKNTVKFKSNNYLRRNGINFEAPNVKKLWEKFDVLRNADEPHDGQSQGQSQEQDGYNFERELENFFSLSYVSPCYMNFTGRIMLNVWRLLRKEIALTSYSFENVYFRVMNRRVPYYSYNQLCQWFSSKSNLLRGRVFEYFSLRVRGCIELLEKMDVIGRHSELARVFGIQFSDVIAKGTQFRVESLLYRSAIKDTFQRNRPFSRNLKSQNFMLLSCDFKKRNRQHDPFTIPFVMDPFSGFYTDPIAVLDFQSLYPSVMIAYNYCYSTCLGRLESLIDPRTDFFGCSSLRLDQDFLREHLHDVTVSPNGLIFLKQHVRKGVLCSILEELLNTRIMVKNSIKLHSKKDEFNKRLLRQLDARQLGLKLIANVTYGYTAAGFSGRMPCVDLADAIISKGRETLMEAIRLVQQSGLELGCDVVYGDTDSMFVRFSGLSVEEAFHRAALLCDRITACNPKPIKIRLEKVYSRSVLLTKKRYAGYSYESLNDVPKLECKGIETVRRDSIPLVKRIFDRALRLLFCNTETDLSSLTKELRAFLETEFQCVLKRHRSRLHEFVFAREYRGQFGYRPGQMLPSIVIAEQLVSRYGENCRPFSKQRVPYVVCCGERPKEPLFRLVQLPLDLLHADNVRLNCSFYIEKVLIPPLQRVFGLLGCNLFSWFQDMPGKSRFLFAGYANCQMGTVADFFQTDECTLCEGRIGRNGSRSSFFPLCESCIRSPKSTVVQVTELWREVEQKFFNSSKACHFCTGANEAAIACRSIDCPNLFQAHADRLLMGKQKQVFNQLNELAEKFYESSF